MIVGDMNFMKHTVCTQ